MQVPPRRDGSVLTSIWIIPSVVLLLATAVLAWVSYDEYRETIRQEYRFLDAHARIAQNQVGGLVQNVRRVAARIAQEVAARPPRQRAEYAPRLAEYSRDFPEIHTLAIVGPTGRVEMAAKPSLVGFDGSKREYFTAHQSGPQRFDFHVSRPYKSVYGAYSVGFSLPILDDGKQLLGIVVAGVHYTYFDNVMKEVRPAESGSSMAIVNNDGDMIYRQPDPESNVGRNASGNQALQAFLRAGRHTTYGLAQSQLHGGERMYVFRAIADTPLNVGVSLPLHDVLATWRRNFILRATLFVLGGALVLRLTWLAHRRQQEALAGKEFSERLIETANAMVVGVDAESRVVTVNGATERITGYRREELVGRSFFDTAMPRDRFPRVWKAFERSRQTGELPRAFEAPLLTRSGEIRIIAWQNNGIFAHGDTLAILAFGIDVTERAHLQQLRNREEISRRMVAVQEEERRRVAMELHDRTSPNLSILDINLKLIASAMPKDTSPEVMHLIEDSCATLTDTIASIRSAALDFRPPLLDYAGLWPALEAYARQFQVRTGIDVQLTGQKALRLPPDVETNLFHVAQEALANCAKHSRATHILIRQTMHGRNVILLVMDDGVGFDPGVCDEGQGLGMMRQRAEFIGGRFSVGAYPGKGTCVAVEFRLCRACGGSGESLADYSPASQVRAPRPAMRPLARQAVSR